ncbi:MAG TPA: hypothetical protein VJT15_23225 [Pyrinomonadaceae bacterium]|nr:hypothetical protein [Pyrinomonadaceae bacterium]
MSFLVSLKVVRLLLAFSVSLWLAGGCLFGCSKMAMAAPAPGSDAAAVEGDSCHAEKAHDCCAKQKAPKQNPVPVSQTETLLAQTQGLASLASFPHGSAGDCPLVINSTAITSKNNSNSPAPAYASNAALPLSESDGEIPQKHVVAPLLPNRGPTYLRCCVFLI